MKETDTHVFFFNGGDFLSNFYRSPFVVNGIRYSCNEQYIMAQKALLFGDIDACNNILACTSPHDMKQYGRRVKNFDEKIWLENRDKILYDGLYAKFTQNKILYENLKKTGIKTLVEASPYDKIYGVGLAENDPKILDENNWRGENLLGYTLMRVRASI